jgi:4-hydroxy-tetrahydrodipicolinate synthase
MAPYSKDEARAWAWSTMRGCTNIILPSFTPDFSTVDEAAIRHDVRRNIEFGFWGSLCIPEPKLSLEEYLDIVRYSVDEAGDRLQIMHYASFNSLEECVEATNLAEAAGAVATLLAYPPGFYPRDSEDIFRWTKSFCDQTDPAVIARLVDACPNLVAVKSEGGYPALSGLAHTLQLVGDKVIVTSPIESQAIPLRQLGIDLQWQAPSDLEIYGDAGPRMWRLLDDGKQQEAWELYWRLQPARAIHPVLSLGGNLINWWAWKYIGWLNGMNGGALRVPTQRLEPQQMAAGRRALVASGIEVTSDPDELFFVGRSASGQIKVPAAAAAGN